MPDKPSKFYGRDKELTWLRRHIFGWGEEEAHSPILLLHGQPGAGKSALVRYFLDTYTAEGGLLRTANFTWSGSGRTGTPERFAELLLETAETAIPELSRNRHLLALSRESPARSSGGGLEQSPASDTYTIHGEPREVAIQPVRQGREYELSLQVKDALKAWLGPSFQSGSRELDALFRLIFIFESFESYPTPVKKWLGGNLFPTLQAGPEIPGISVILTGTQPWESSGQADYWEAHPGSFFQCEIGPLPRHVCEEWLQDTGLRAGLLDLLYEETEGYPGRVMEALGDVEELKRRHQSRFDPDDPLGTYTPQQRRWLHALAIQPQVNLEAIQVLLGRVEGLQAFGWASRNVGFCRVETDAQGEHYLTLHDEMRDAVLRQTQEQMPARHREFMDKVEIINSVQAKVGLAEHRAKLRLLTPVQPFNHKLIEAVFRKNA